MATHPRRPSSRCGPGARPGLRHVAGAARGRVARRAWVRPRRPRLSRRRRRGLHRRRASSFSPTEPDHLVRDVPRAAGARTRGVALSKRGGRERLHCGPLAARPGAGGRVRRGLGVRSTTRTARRGARQPHSRARRAWRRRGAARGRAAAGRRRRLRGAVRPASARGAPRAPRRADRASRARRCRRRALPPAGRAHARARRARLGPRRRGARLRRCPRAGARGAGGALAP